VITLNLSSHCRTHFREDSNKTHLDDQDIKTYIFIHYFTN